MQTRLTLGLAKEIFFAILLLRQVFLLSNDRAVATHQLLAFVAVDSGVRQAGIFVAFELIDSIVHQGFVEYIQAHGAHVPARRLWYSPPSAALARSGHTCPRRHKSSEPTPTSAGNSLLP